MSGRRARSRERLQSRKERERWSRFTDELAVILQHLRIGELECGRPGGCLVRVLGGNDCGGGGGICRREGESKLEPNPSD
jgi:hypothetical protein